MTCEQHPVMSQKLNWVLGILGGTAAIAIVILSFIIQLTGAVHKVAGQMEYLDRQVQQHVADRLIHKQK